MWGCSTPDLEPARPLESAARRDLGGEPDRQRGAPDEASSKREATTEPAPEIVLRPATVASFEQRAAAAIALLTDGVSANRLPVISTDAGKPFDDALANEMARPRQKPYVNMDWPFFDEDIQGDFDRDLLRERVRLSFRPLHNCYLRALAGEPTLRGDVALSFEVARDGRVRRADVIGESLTDPAVGRCMAKASLSWKLPRPRDGKRARVTLHFSLAPGTHPSAGDR
jgi:TonB family protein